MLAKTTRVGKIARLLGGGAGLLETYGKASAQALVEAYTVPRKPCVAVLHLFNYSFSIRCCISNRTGDVMGDSNNFAPIV